MAVFDVLVAGGGPAGSAAAIALAQAGRRVVLADAPVADRDRLKVGESLPPAARPLLMDLGLLETVESGGHLRSCATSAAWGSTRLVANDFVFDPNGHGWHLDRQRFDRSLRVVAAGAGVDVRVGATASVCGRWVRGWRVGLGDRGEVHARALVDATGRRAALARAIGARRERSDRLVGVFGSAPARPGDVDARTLVEAMPDGWWYTALVPGRRRVAVLLSDADLVPPDVRTPAGFLSALGCTDHIGPLLADGAIEPRTEPAHGSRLRPPGGDGWVAVGDAALAFDPLSSQGMTTALYTGLAGARAIDAHLGGHPQALDDYAARIAAIGAAYEQNRLHAYAAEWRWPERPFWARRRPQNSTRRPLVSGKHPPQRRDGAHEELFGAMASPRRWHR
jgi:flavin-dependent dehydrogenase